MINRQSGRAARVLPRSPPPLRHWPRRPLPAAATGSRPWPPRRVRGTRLPTRMRRRRKTPGRRLKGQSRGSLSPTPGPWAWGFPPLLRALPRPPRDARPRRRSRTGGLLRSAPWAPSLATPPRNKGPPPRARGRLRPPRAGPRNAKRSPRQAARQRRGKSRPGGFIGTHV